MSRELDVAFDHIINCRTIFIFRNDLSELELQVNKYIPSIKITRYFKRFIYDIALVEEVHSVLVVPLHRQADPIAKDSNVVSATRSVREKSLLRSAEDAAGHSGK